MDALQNPNKDHRYPLVYLLDVVSTLEPMTWLLAKRVYSLKKIYDMSPGEIGAVLCSEPLSAGMSFQIGSALISISEAFLKRSFRYA